MDAINAVPHEYREGALALGATPMHTLFSVVLPAKKTILAGVVLGMGRTGETMAVMLISGNRPTCPALLDPPHDDKQRALEMKLCQRPAGAVVCRPVYIHHGDQLGA